MSAVKAILVENGKFSEVSLPDTSNTTIAEVIGASMVTRLATPFNMPFVFLVDEAGQYRQKASAIVVDLNSPTGTNALFGKALVLRVGPKSFNVTIKDGDLEKIRNLPIWIRFDNLERRNIIPQASDVGNFDPQFQLILAGMQKMRLVFFNALIAVAEHEVIALHVASTSMHTQFEMMVEPVATDKVKAFLDRAFSREGELRKPWIDVGC